MRSELFEEAWKQNRHVWESTKCLAQAMYLAGEKHQQSKVDELQKQLIDQGQRFNEQVQHVKDLEHKSGKLQKRVDASQKLIDDWNCGGVNLFDLLDELEQALKGDKS